MADLFSGMGGWQEGLRLAGGGEALGVELSPAPCATAGAAGHHVLQGDVSDLDPRSWWGVEGLVASPPCQAFSLAGMGEGRGLMADLARGVRAAFAGRRVSIHQHDSRLVVEPARWVHALRPRWVALEQVPPVLPLWKLYVHELRAMGYRAWAGTLNVADYGVPQTRVRALLVATRDLLRLPEPTHAHHELPAGLWGPARARWVSMADALGWTRQVVEGLRVNTRGDRGPDPAGGNEFSVDGPSWAITGRTRSWTFASTTLEPWQGLVLQGFPPDYPLQGGRTVQWRQIGNAFPPPMAAALLRALITEGEAA